MKWCKGHLIFSLVWTVKIFCLHFFERVFYIVENNIHHLECTGRSLENKIFAFRNALHKQRSGSLHLSCHFFFFFRSIKAQSRTVKLKQRSR